MATTVTIDLQDGSYYQGGAFDDSFTQAVRAAVAENDDGSNLALIDGYTAIAAAASTTHPGYSLLPKQYVRVTKFGKKVLGRVFYRQQTRSFGGSDDPFAVVDVDAFEITMPWYSRWEDGTDIFGDAPFPNGEVPRRWDDDGKELVVRPYERRITVARISVRVAPSSSVFGTCMPLVNTTNDAAFTMGGKSFPANSLRFRFSQRAVLIDNNSAEFRVTYEFLYRPDTWINEVWPEDDSRVPELADMFERATWPVPFPT